MMSEFFSVLGFPRLLDYLIDLHSTLLYSIYLNTPSAHHLMHNMVFRNMITFPRNIPGITYPIVSRWVWSDEGWLNRLGYSDFAGSGAVHLFAGTCSFVAAYLMGPRIGRFGNGRYSTPPPGHSLPVRKSR